MYYYYYYYLNCYCYYLNYYYYYYLSCCYCCCCLNYCYCCCYCLWYCHCLSESMVFCCYCCLYCTLFEFEKIVLLNESFTRKIFFIFDQKFEEKKFRLQINRPKILLTYYQKRTRRNQIKFEKKFVRQKKKVRRMNGSK